MGRGKIPLLWSLACVAKVSAEVRMTKLIKKEKKISFSCKTYTKMALQKIQKFSSNLKH